jgi:hypothetical protein
MSFRLEVGAETTQDGEVAVLRVMTDLEKRGNIVIQVEVVEKNCDGPAFTRKETVTISEVMLKQLGMTIGAALRLQEPRG